MLPCNAPLRCTTALDLAIIQTEPLTLRITSRLKSAFDDSDLPISVDVVDWNQADSAFKAMVTKQGMVELQQQEHYLLLNLELPAPVFIGLEH